MPLGAFWPPPGHLFAHSGSFRGAFGGFWTTNRRAKPSKTLEMNPDARGNGKPPRTCRDSDEDCREPTKNCREPSRNPPRTCRTNPKQRNLSRYGFYESTSFSDRRSNKTPRTKVGREDPWRAMQSTAAGLVFPGGGPSGGRRKEMGGSRRNEMRGMRSEE